MMEESFKSAKEVSAKMPKSEKSATKFKSPKKRSAMKSKSEKSAGKTKSAKNKTRSAGSKTMKIKSAKNKTGDEKLMYNNQKLGTSANEVAEAPLLLKSGWQEGEKSELQKTKSAKEFRKNGQGNRNGFQEGEKGKL